MRKRTLKAAREWIDKATFTSGDLSGGTKGGLLNPDQAKKFLQLITDASELLGLFRQETSDSPVLEIDRVSLHGTRVLRAGTEATRLDDADRVEATTGKMELTTGLFRAEIPISDEALEDNIEKEGFSDTLTTLIAEAIARDAEEIALKSKSTATAHTNAAFAKFDGFFQLADVASAANSTVYTATGKTDPEEILEGLYALLPPRHRRNPSGLIFLMPDRFVLAYLNAIRLRGTALGDTALINGIQRPTYNNVPVLSSPLSSGAAEAGIGNIDFRTHGLIFEPSNFVVGWQRRFKFEDYRDPREGAASKVVSLRYSVGIADPYALAFTKTLDTGF